MSKPKHKTKKELAAENDRLETERFQRIAFRGKTDVVWPETLLYDFRTWTRTGKTGTNELSELPSAEYENGASRVWLEASGKVVEE